jgi:diguanylate cyclase (GGDEF)-like protein/PAS domain S-box-containing protein
MRQNTNIQPSSESTVSQPVPPTPQQANNTPPEAMDWSSYLHTLFSCLREGVIFVDRQYRIRTWSQSVELITGQPRVDVLGQTVRPTLMNLHDHDGRLIPEDRCPVAGCLQSGKIRKGNYRIIGRSGREVKVEIAVTPVVDDQNFVQGAVVIVHDASVQLDLQRQLRDLYEISVLDPLTQIANRGEFERVLSESLRSSHMMEDYNTCLIICDIDYFKSINDNYNHHVGDQALISFAGQLKQFVRSQDLVCRYGGEEFVILCTDCDIAAAIERAEEIRKSLEVTPQSMLNGKCITASFGVSQLRENDSATDFFVRADSALLKAKELGRNRVVAAKAPSGDRMEMINSASVSGIDWRKDDRKALSSNEFVTQTPVSVLVAKLRGFILEFDAEIRQVESDFASVEVELEDRNDYSRRGRFRVTFEFQEKEVDTERGPRNKSFIRIVIREAKRKWFSTNSTDLAPALLSEIRRYMMLNDESSEVKVDVATAPTPGR